MATSNIMQNLQAGDMTNVNRAMPNLGVPVQNNQGTPSLAGSHGTNVSGTVPTSVGTQPMPDPTAPGNTIMQQIQPGNGGVITPDKGPVHMGQQQAYTAQNGAGTLLTPNGGAPVNSSGAVPAGNTSTSPTANMTAQQQQELQKQLVDTFGKGEGNLLDTVLGSIGGGDDAYMQAYEAAMAQPNAENLATLNTTLGNSGIGANSSTSAIANADFQSGITAQEGLQEQGLQMNDLQQLLGLTEGLENPSAQEVSSGGFLNDFASIMGSIGAIIPGASGGASFMSRGGSAPGPSSSSNASGVLASMQGQSGANIGINPTDPSVSDTIPYETQELQDNDIFV